MSKSLPLVNLSVVRPLVSGLRDRGIDPEPVLAAVGLTEAAIMDDGTTVHVMVVHQFLERAAEAVGDQAFCAEIGGRINPEGWPMIARALDQACSLAEFLSIYVSGANAVSSSVTAYLDIRGQIAMFGEARLFRPSIVPAQNDGFMVGLSLAILRLALGERLSPAEMSIVVCDPSVLPADMAVFQALRGDEMGFRIQFPSDWLAYSVGKHAKTHHLHDGLGDQVGSGFLADFRTLLGDKIERGGATADEAAALVAMSRSKLARRLKDDETTISMEIERAKRRYAEKELEADTLSIDRIHRNFAKTRWATVIQATSRDGNFKRVSGLSPSGYRRKHLTSRRPNRLTRAWAFVGGLGAPTKPVSCRIQNRTSTLSVKL